MSQTSRDTLFIPQDNRANFKNVIAKRSDLVQFGSGRMKPAGAGLYVTYEAGLVLGAANSGVDAGFLKPYSSVAVDGSQIPVGVLSEQVQTDEFGNGSEAVIIRSAPALFQDLLIGFDANAASVLGAKSFIEHGVNLVRF